MRRGIVALSAVLLSLVTADAQAGYCATTLSGAQAIRSVAPLRYEMPGHLDGQANVRAYYFWRYPMSVQGIPVQTFTAELSSKRFLWGVEFKPSGAPKPLFKTYADAAPEAWCNVGIVKTEADLTCFITTQNPPVEGLKEEHFFLSKNEKGELVPVLLCAYARQANIGLLGKPLGYKVAQGGVACAVGASACYELLGE